MKEPGLTIDPIETEEALTEAMSEPSPEAVEAVSQIAGDVMILGIAGKMGPTLGRLLVRAGARKVIGVSRFSNPADREMLDAAGIETLRCDLLDDEGLRGLPDVDHIYLLAGHKFGSTGNEPITWAMNTLLPAKVLQRFPASKIVYVSSGNVYRFARFDSGGSTEQDALEPIGEYAQSRLGGERIVEFYSARNATPCAIIRLFYATELRYGIILDIAEKVWGRRPIDLAMGHVNQIWQGDAAGYLARCFPLCESPARVLNLTGSETLSVREVAARLGRTMGIEPIFEGEEAETALLGNVSELVRLFGHPKVTPSQIEEWVAWWVMNEMPTHGKPTKYESRTGRF